MTIPKQLKVPAAVLFSLTLLFSQVGSTVSARISEPQRKLFGRGIKYYNHDSCQPGEASSNGDVDLSSSEDNAKNVFIYFTSKGYTAEQAAGIIGNMTEESGVEPQRQQSIFDRKIPAERFPDPAGGSGWGIVQWTPGSKFITPVKNDKKDPNDLKVQLDFLFNQLEGKGPLPEKQAGDQLKATQTIEQAVLAFQGNTKVGGQYTGFERPDDQAGSVPKRLAAAKAAFRKFSGLAGSSASFGGSAVSSDCSCHSTPQVSGGNLDDTLKQLAKENGGQTKISVQSLKGGDKGNFEGTDVMPTRSSYKLYTAYATLRAIEDNRITWGTSIWGGKSVEDAMEAMIVKSDNNAAEALRTSSKIGSPAKVTTMLQNDVGLSEKTVMGSGNADDPTGSNSKSTANDFVKFLVKLERKQLPGVEDGGAYKKLLGYMKRATTDGASARDGIAKGVKDEAAVADKPGWAPGPEDPASNDVGIVYLDGKEYVIAILTDKPSKWDGVAKIAAGVNEAMKGSAEPADNGGDCAENGAVSGDLQATTKNYAHAEYHAAPFIERRPAYAEAVEKAKRDGRYYGGTVRGVEGIDCGGFVTLLVQDSGYDKNYNYGDRGGGNTVTQEQWLKENWEQISPKSTGDLKPGDVAVNSEHTYIFVGDVEGFNSKIASASYTTYENGGRAPMAGKETPADSNFNWYRKK